MWFIYFLYSIKSHITYVGISENPLQRLKEHNSGKSKFTKGHIPWILFYEEQVSEDVKLARIKEKHYKSSGRLFVKQKLKDFLDSN